MSGSIRCFTSKQNDQYSLEIEFSRGHLCSRLIGYWPHDHRGMVLVPTYKLVHDCQMMGQRGVLKAATTRHKRRTELTKLNQHDKTNIPSSTSLCKNSEDPPNNSSAYQQQTKTTSLLLKRMGSHCFQIWIVMMDTTGKSVLCPHTLWLTVRRSRCWPLPTIKHTQRSQRCEPWHSHVFDAHPRALVYHHDAMAVTHLQDLLGVGVVAGAERVGPQPLQQVKVLNNQGPVQAFTPDLLHKVNRGL